MTTVGEILGNTAIPYISPLQITDSIMYSFAMQTESVIASELQKFKDNGPETEEIEISAEDGIYQSYDHYYGLTDSDVFLNDMFTEYFPSLNRRSAFQTIYSAYEVELQALCRRYQSILGGKKFDNYQGSGIVLVHDFVKSRFPILASSSEWKMIDRLRVLRNNCVHRDGRAYKTNGTIIPEINELINENSNIFHHDGYFDEDSTGKEILYPSGGVRRKGRYVLFESGSLSFSIKAFQAYAKVVHEEYEKIKPRTTKRFRWVVDA